jgi:hypothetical protein
MVKFVMHSTEPANDTSSYTAEHRVFIASILKGVST